MHLFEQHRPFWKQPNEPLVMQPHVPLLQLPEQHWLSWKHPCPSALHAFGSAHLKLKHLAPLQQSLSWKHCVPICPHPPAPHLKLVHLPLQQSLS